MRATILAFVALAFAAGTAAADLHGVALPHGSRVTDDRATSSLGFRATVDWYAHQWSASGAAVKTIGPYRARGVDVVRFVREDRGGPWLAVHIYRQAGTTWIAVVPRPALDAPPPSG